VSHFNFCFCAHVQVTSEGYCPSRYETAITGDITGDIIRGVVGDVAGNCENSRK